MKELDLNKPVQTRDGHEARIICTDRKHKDYPVIALITEKDRKETLKSFTLDGRYLEDTKRPNDLINVPEKKEGWINLYCGTVVNRTAGAVHDTKEKALNVAKSTPTRFNMDYITTTKIEWEE